MKLFYAYSHKDEALREELEVHLSLLKRQGFLDDWHDRKLSPGVEWEAEIMRELGSAQVILLLVSADFLASDFCYGREMKFALERHEIGQARVIPIMLRECDWEHAPFAKIQALPKDAYPVASWDNKDSAWTTVAKGIRHAIQELGAVPERVSRANEEEIRSSDNRPVRRLPIEVCELRFRPTEKNTTWWRYSWVAEVENRTKQHILFDLEIEFLDKEGFVVDRGGKTKLTLTPDERRSIRDFSLINAESAPKIANLGSSVKIRAVEEAPNPSPQADAKGAA